MKTTTILLIILLSLFLNFNTQAQRKKEIIGLSYTYFAPAEVVDTLGSKEFKGLKIGAGQFELFGNIPTLTLGENTKIDNHLDFSVLQYHEEQSLANGNTFGKLDALFQINYALTLTQKFGKGWYVHLTGQPGIASNLKNGLQSEDFVMQGNGAIHKSFKEDGTLNFGIGLSYTNLLAQKESKLRLLPLIDFYGKFGKIELDVFAPYYGHIYFLVSEKLKFGLTGKIQGNYYHLSSKDAANLKNIKASVNFMYGGVSVVWQCYKNIILDLNGGMNINRTFEIRSNNKNVLQDFDPEKLSLGYFQAKIAVLLNK